MAPRYGIAWWILFWCSLPAVLETSLELYLLTLSGQQMLFFSLSHAATTIVVVPLLVSVACFLALALLNLVRFAVKVFDAGAYVFAFQVVHVLLLMSYEVWASIAALRIPIALGAIAFGVFVLWKVFGGKSPEKQLPRTIDV